MRVEAVIEPAWLVRPNVLYRVNCRPVAVIVPIDVTAFVIESNVVLAPVLLTLRAPHVMAPADWVIVPVPVTVNDTAPLPELMPDIANPSVSTNVIICDKPRR